MSAREEILAKATALPQMPVAVQRILTYLGKSDADFRRLAEIIELDPGITVNVLRMANAPYFGSAGRVTTVQDAVFLLGVNRVYQLVLASGVVPRTKGEVKGYGLAPGDLLRHSVGVAVGAEAMAAVLSLVAPPHVFTAGLLADIGKTVMGEFLELDAKPILELAASRDIPFEQAEREVLGIDHAELGSLLLKHWEIPEPIVRCVRWMLDPCSAPLTGLDIDLVHLGHVLSCMAGLGLGVDGLVYVACDKSFERLGVTQEAMFTATERMIAGLTELEPMFLNL
ncbi:hypothetical protein JCM15519_13690 [Fundidesulfovibrio butyratiphilus]